MAKIKKLKKYLKDIGVDIHPRVEDNFEIFQEGYLLEDGDIINQDGFVLGYIDKGNGYLKICHETNCPKTGNELTFYFENEKTPAYWEHYSWYSGKTTNYKKWYIVKETEDN